MSRQPNASPISNSAAENALRPLDGIPAESAIALEHWLDTLAECPLDQWIAVGHECAHDVPARERRATSKTLLECIVANQQLELTVWFIEDMVQTAAHGPTVAASRARPSVQRNLREARSAAHWAALAIATQSWLPRVDREALCAPFEAVMRGSALRLV